MSTNFRSCKGQSVIVDEGEDPLFIRNEPLETKRRPHVRRARRVDVIYGRVFYDLLKMEAINIESVDWSSQMDASVFNVSFLNSAAFVGLKGVGRSLENYMAIELNQLSNLVYDSKNKMAMEGHTSRPTIQQLWHENERIDEKINFEITKLFSICDEFRTIVHGANLSHTWFPVFKESDRRQPGVCQSILNLKKAQVIGTLMAEQVVIINAEHPVFQVGLYILMIFLRLASAPPIEVLNMMQVMFQAMEPL